MHTDAAAAFAAALRAHQAGDLEAAIAAYRCTLDLDGGHPGALVNLAAALRRAGRVEEALQAYRAAVAVAGELPEVWFNLGNAWRDLQRDGEAMDAYRRALALDPRLAGAHFRLAELLHAAGRDEEALTHWRETVVQEPDHAPAWRRLIAAEEASGRASEASRLVETALGRIPTDAWLLRRLAIHRRDAGDLAAAAELYLRLVGLRPDDALAHDGLGVVLAAAGDLDGALDALERARAIAPDHAGVLANLATLHTRRNRLDLAIPLYRRALALEPDLEEATTGLVKSLARGGACEEAISVAAAAVHRHPERAELAQALGYALTLQGRIGEALDAFAAARRSDPAHVLGALNAAFTSLYSDALDAAAVTALHRDLAGAVAARQPLRPRPATRQADPERRLRVGYLGPDFRGHPVGYFIESALAHHDPAAVEVVCYADVANPDAVTARLRGLVAQWRDVYGWTSERLAARIRDDEIDVLVDLAGHSAGHTALLLPRRPAPVQALYLGYPCTSGVAAVDYLISDAIVSPPALAALYTERLVPLDGCFLCFRPHPEAPEVEPPPLLARGFVTFGCYNNLPKVSARAVALWARVLRGVRDSRLVLEAPGLDDPPTRERLWRRFDEQGIDRSRVALLGITSPLARFLAEYARMDVALDTVPYVGGTTTCEALWMGVPVVTLAGRHFYARMGASILTHAGLTELVAASEDDYVRIAVDLARDGAALARMRAGLRARVRGSRLCDGPAYARALEAAYRGMWRALPAQA